MKRWIKDTVIGQAAQQRTDQEYCIYIIQTTSLRLDLKHVHSSEVPLYFS